MKALTYHYERIYPYVLKDPSFKNMEEKILYCHILAFELDKKVCFTHDETLAERLGKTVAEVQEMLRDLSRRKKIKIVHQPGVTARILKTTRQPEPETIAHLIDVFDLA